MNRALTAPTTASETKWTVIKGSMAGTVRLMTSSHFTMGRSPDCEFIIGNDPKCSRRHATVTWTRPGYEITSLAAANLILVNGREVHRAVLTNDDIVTVGTTEIQFNITTQPTTANVQLRRLAAVPNTNSGITNARSHRQPKRSASVSPRLLIYLGLGLVVMYLLFGTSAKKKDPLKIRGEDQIQEAIENANKLREAADKMSLQRLSTNTVARQAQENYVRGFRDFRKGQFERALDSFGTCLALNPSHVLCSRYRQLSQRKFNELVQYQIVLGRRYRDQNQFKACKASFRNVMVMVKDASSAAYREAKANYDACHAMVEGRF